MTDPSRKEQLERRLAQSIRLLRQADDLTTRERLHELTEALEREKEREKQWPNRGRTPGVAGIVPEK